MIKFNPSESIKQTAAVIDHFEGMAEACVQMRLNLPLVPVSESRATGGLACVICAGRGLLRLPDGWVTNSKREKVHYLEANVMVCPNCMGIGVPAKSKKAALGNITSITPADDKKKSKK